nr:MAG TPA: hypothetical protein [Caudoviricetes sp.]
MGYALGKMSLPSDGLMVKLNRFVYCERLA